MKVFVGSVSLDEVDRIPTSFASNKVSIRNPERCSYLCSSLITAKNWVRKQAFKLCYSIKQVGNDHYVARNLKDLWPKALCYDPCYGMVKYDS